MNTSINIFSTTAITSDSYNYTVVTGCKIYSSITAAVNGGLIVSNYQNIIFANVMIEDNITLIDKSMWVLLVRLSNTWLIT